MSDTTALRIRLEKVADGLRECLNADPMLPPDPEFIERTEKTLREAIAALARQQEQR